ncbi:extracellular solute-binding protein [Paenibacillus albiflavus]|uniref:Extracellular solute-binding protein n=1 Tax=Paenibacillus albiflavus TaxID=2545760 RepID=A0A4R4EBH6_9BACL|nr:extracellular solute-binding protein [Paenibacillus albiflavus]TCZ77244.1 extracellular solute-binding protein [Paenibacillus albiflavus]
MKPNNVMKLILCVLMVALISGCSLTSTDADQALAKLDDKKETTIRVMYYDEQYFMQRFGNLFMAKYPNINIEVVSTRDMYTNNQDPKTMYAKFIETEKPDVLLLPTGEMERLVGEQLLYDLEPVIAQDKFDIENIQPTIIEYLKMKGGGKLYGLSPTFSNEVLLINRDLFTKQGVQLPEGKLNWEDVMLLAQRFPASQDSSERVYGYSQGTYRNDPYNLMMRIAESSGLTLENEGKSALLTPSWKQLFEQVVAVYKSGCIARDQNNLEIGTTFTQEEWLLRDPFIAGKSAMTIASSYEIGNLIQAERTLKDRSFNWEILSAPAGDQADQSTNFSLNDIFAINSKSSNIRAAWEFIKYINSDEIARVYSKTPNELWSRTSYMTLKDGKSLEPFYELTFNRNETSEHDDYYGVRYQLNDIANKEMDEVIADKKTIDQALEAIDKQLQIDLDQLKTAKDTPAKQ